MRPNSCGHATRFANSSVVVVLLSLAAVFVVPNATGASSAPHREVAQTAPRRIIRDAANALDSASSVVLSGYAPYGLKSLEHFTIAIQSNRDSSASISIGSDTERVIEVAGSEFISASASYWENEDGYSVAQALPLANQWVLESPIPSAEYEQEWGYTAIANDFIRIKGSLSNEPPRHVRGIKVADVHSATGSNVYIADAGKHYPVALNVTLAGARAYVRFSGWNAQPEPVAPVATYAATVYASPNWAGYALMALPGATTQVDGNWVEPTAECSSGQATSSVAWIGVGGLIENKIFQVGTGTDCFKGAQTDYAWFEKYPRNPAVVAIKVQPGDAMSAEIVQTAAGYWSYTLRDLTSHQFVASKSPIAFSGPNNSAEWIEEDPGNSSPYAQLSPVVFTGVEVNGSPVALTRMADGIALVHGEVFAYPSEFSNDSFTVTAG